jgi:hypothetical protein
VEKSFIDKDIKIHSKDLSTHNGDEPTGVKQR